MLESTAPGPAPLRPRFAVVDLARGLALLAMFVFHFAYDLSYFDIVAVDVATDPGWSLFARLIAGSFLVIVGVSLVLATRNGLNRPAFLRRFAMVAGAAALVSLATWFAMPDSFIFFGILHQVAFASLAALPFLALPVWLVAAASALVIAPPHVLAHPLLDHAWLTWLGFSRLPLQTADFVPVFPWFGCVLAGIVLARLGLPFAARQSWAAWQPRAKPARLLAWGGRHSLLVYLVHQPVFIAAILAATTLWPAPIAEDRPFMASCRQGCTAPGLTAQDCEQLCTCTAQGLKREGLWPKVIANQLDPAETSRMAAMAQACLRP